MRLLLFFLLIFLFINPTQAKVDKNILKERNKGVAEIEKVKNSLTKSQKKISSLIRDVKNYVQVQKQTRSFSEIKANISSNTAVFDANERMRVKISFFKTVTESEFDNAVADLEDIGCKITDKYWPSAGVDWRPEIVSFVPLNKIEEVSAKDIVATIQPVSNPGINSGNVLTEGDSQLKANLARSTADNLTGYGVRVGVISNGMDATSGPISNGDLPTDIIQVVNEGGAEGTAMMEIIYDLAPGCSFAFASAGTTTTTMLDRISQLIGVDGGNCKIIVDDVYFPDDPYFKDGNLAQEISQKIIYNNLIYISAAGNDGESIYTANYNEYDDGSSQWHEFYRENNYQYIENIISLEAGQEIEIILQWADIWDNPAADFDIYLYEMGQNTSLGTGGKDTQGSSNPPREILSYTNNSESAKNYEIMIKNNSLGTNDSYPRLKLLAENRTDGMPSIQLQFTHKEGAQAENQIYGHPAAEHVISVAAYDALNQNHVEDYSSRGPTYLDNTDNINITRYTPTITATDNVKITGAGDFGYEDENGDIRFAGTSAAAPHIAGIAALYKQKYPGAGYSEFTFDLKDNAADMGSYSGGSWHRVSGWGKADAQQTIGTSLPIVVDQKYSNGVSIGGSFDHWETTDWVGYTAPYTFYWEKSETHKLRAANEVVSGEKFYDWQESKYINFNTFSITSSSSDINAHFNPAKTATIGTSLKSGGTGGNIKFKDPWLRDYNDETYGLRNRGMSAALFKSKGASYTLSTSSEHQGVFLNQLVDANKPYYSIQAEATQTIEVHDKNIPWYFTGWSTSSATITSPNNLVDGHYQSPVVFTDNNASVTANYKGHYVSANPQATGHNNGRRVARDDNGNLHLVYEDNGAIWYCSSSDGGEIWSPEEKIYSDNDYTAVNPSITYLDNQIYVSWAAYSDEPLILVSYKTKNLTNTSWSAVHSITAYIETGISGESIDLNEKIPSTSIAVLKNSSNDDKVVAVAYDYYAGSTYFTEIGDSYGNVTVLFGENPSLNTDTHFSINNECAAIVYESDGEIIFQNLSYLSSNSGPTLSTAFTVSQQYDEIVSYEKPNVTYFNSDAHIVWEGYNSSTGKQEVFYRRYNPSEGNYIESSGLPGQVYQPEGTINISSSNYDVLNPSIGLEYNSEENRTYTSVFYTKDNTIYKQNFKNGFVNGREVYYGSGNYPSVLCDELEGCVWTTEESAPYFLDSDYYTPAQPIPIIGPVNPNWGSLDFVLSAGENGGQQGLISIGLESISYSSDTLDFNQQLETENTTVSGNYELLNMDLRVKYTDVNQLPTDLVFNLSFVDAADTIALSSLSFSELPQNASGSGERFFKLTRVLNLGNRTGHFCFGFNGRVPKVRRVVRTLDDVTLPKEQYSTPINPSNYNMSQNYPNPFNPITHITFTLPEPQTVSLSVYNTNGQKVKELVSGHQSSGIYEVVFDGTGLSSGLYFYRLTAGKFTSVKRMLLLK